MAKLDTRRAQVKPYLGPLGPMQSLAQWFSGGGGGAQPQRRAPAKWRTFAWVGPRAAGCQNKQRFASQSQLEAVELVEPQGRRPYRLYLPQELPEPVSKREPEPRPEPGAEPVDTTPYQPRYAPSKDDNTPDFWRYVKRRKTSK